MSFLKRFFFREVIKPPEEAYEIAKKEFLAYRYKNLAFLVLSLIFAFWLSGNDGFHNFLSGLDGLGYFGAFVGGFLFVSTFTVATAGLVLLILAREMNPVALVLFAGTGALIADLLMFRFVKDGIEREVEALYEHFGSRHLAHILHSPHFRWVMPVIGALLIASPLPDEIGVSLMGISKMKTSHFALFSLVLNVVGILFLMILGKTFQF